MNEFDDEIVWVKDGHHLIDAESYERRYSIDSSRSVTPGYYVAEWPGESAVRHFLDEHLVLTGPYRTRKDAQSAARARTATSGG